MEIRDRQAVRGRLSPGLAFAGSTALAVAAVWALGVPGADPVGGVFDAMRNGAGNYADWARQGPVDGHPDWTQNFRPVAGGDPARGHTVVRDNGCGACHTIPGVAWARGTVGPSLAGFADRAYFAGEVPNNASDLVAYLVAPSSFTPETVMPDTGLTTSDAANAAAFLYTLSERP